MIDPTLQISQFIGAGSEGRAIAVDNDGKAYFTGVTGDISVTNGSTLITGVKDPSFWDSVAYVSLLLAPIFAEPSNVHFFWIHNVWMPDQYLNVENGPLASTSLGPEWLSARWTLEPAPGTTLYQIRNAWKPDMYLNIQNGELTAGPISPGWWSALWSFERVD